jgi:hypothetical protein
MNVPSPLASNTPMTEMFAAHRVFRGMRKPNWEWSPREALCSTPAAWEEVAAVWKAGRASYEHVLRDLLGGDGKARRAVSFSFSKAPAFYYATSSGSSALPYRYTGHIGSFALPPIVRAVTGGGAAPFLYLCADGTVWLDPRHFGGVAVQFANTPVHAIELAQNSARVDDEILLVHGRIRASSVARVNPKSYPPSFLPWQRMVESLPQFRHLLTVPALTEHGETNPGLLGSLF